MVIITEVDALEHTSEKLREFEAQFRVESSEFYVLYQQGQISIDPLRAAEWAWFYEAYIEAFLVEAQERTFGGGPRPSSKSMWGVLGGTNCAATIFKLIRRNWKKFRPIAAFVPTKTQLKSL